MRLERWFAERIEEQVGDVDDPRAGTFARGLVVGALVGAAIAGSTIWQRRQARRHEAEAVGATEEPGSPSPAAAEPGSAAID